MSTLQIHVLPALTDNFIYALTDSNGHCAVIDPGEAKPVLEFLDKENLKLVQILCTHHHWDHVNGVAELVAHFNVPVTASNTEFPRVPHATEALREGEKYSLLDTSFEVLEVPGHTLGQICFWFAEINALFVGDTLFSCGCGRLFEGTYEQLFSSLRKIASLPPETEIYFGHEYTLNNIAFLEANGQSSADLQEYKKNSLAKLARQNHTTPVTLANELALNPFLKAQSIDELKKWREARNSW